MLHSSAVVAKSSSPINWLLMTSDAGHVFFHVKSVTSSEKFFLYSDYSLCVVLNEL